MVDQQVLQKYRNRLIWSRLNWNRWHWNRSGYLWYQVWMNVREKLRRNLSLFLVHVDGLHLSALGCSNTVAVCWNVGHDSISEELVL